VEISQKFVAFSEYLNFILKCNPKRNPESTQIELPLAFHSQSAVSREKLVMDGKVLYLICAK
jgi:hypothetical protein